MNTNKNTQSREAPVDFKDLDKKNQPESYTSAWNYRYPVSGYNKTHPMDKKR